MFATDNAPAQPLVRLVNYDVTPEHFAAMRYVEEVGFDFPILLGGGLRDMAFDDVAICDFDFMAGCKAMQQRFDAACAAARRASRDPYRIAPRDPGAEIKDMLEQCLGAHPGTQELKYLGWSRMDGGGYAAEFKIRCASVSLPLHIAALHELQGIEEVCAFGDAPLNCIAMDAGGRVFAHPHFPTHAAARIYAPFETEDEGNAQKRFAHLAAKIPGLRYEAPHRPPRGHQAAPAAASISVPA